MQLISKIILIQDSLLFLDLSMNNVQLMISMTLFFNTILINKLIKPHLFNIIVMKAEISQNFIIKLKMALKFHHLLSLLNNH